MTSTSSYFKNTESNGLDTLVLRIPSVAKWKQFGCVVLALPNYLLWNVMILVTVVLNYMFVTTDLAFSHKNYENFLHFYIIFDILYLFNFTILILHKTFTSLTLVQKKDYSLIIITIDFLSLLPQILLLLLLVDRSFSLFIPLLRVFSILRLRHMVLFRKVLGNLTEHRWKWFVGQYITVFCISVHTANCVWYLIQCGESCNNKLYNSTPKPSQTPVKWYFQHIYYLIEVFLNIGFGDIFPMSFNEIYLFSTMLIIGQALTVWFACYITLLLIFQNYQKVYIAYKIKDAKLYVEDTDEGTKAKISQYYSMKGNNFEDNSFLELLPPSLKQDISYDLNCGLLHRSKILKDLPEPILKKISLTMKTVILVSGENIYYQYVIKTCMVCIEDGILEVLNDEDQESPVIFFRNGTILGEVALFFNIPSKASVRARGNTELRILEKRDFLEIMIHFPEHFKSLQTILSKRLISANKPRKTIHTFCLPSLRRLKVKLSNIFVKDDNDDGLDEYYDLYRLHKEGNVLDNKNSWVKVFN